MSWCAKNIHSQIETVMNLWTEINLRDLRYYLDQRSQRASLLHANFNQWVELHVENIYEVVSRVSGKDCYDQ